MKALLHNKTIMVSLLLFFFFGNMRHLQAQTVWDGTADTDWYTNNPSATSFDISTAEELAGLAQLCNANNTFSGKTINLTADIWLNADNTTTNEWIPIGIGASGEAGCLGSGSASFNGTFNGNFYKIYNMYINRSSNSGFFLKIVAATIERIILVNPTVISSGMSGCLVGFVGLSTTTSSIIRNCMVINGNINSGCNNNALLIGATWPNGNNNGATTHIQNCGVTGTVSGAGSYYGGITGNGGSTQTVNCYAAYTNSGSNQTAGISGYGGTLTNSYSNFDGGILNARQNGIIKTLAEMQLPEFATTLGSAWIVDADNINNGYPVLNPCVPPSNVTANVGPYSADFSWSGVANITNYYVEYGTQGFTPGTGAEAGSDYVSSATASIPSGLSPSTNYTFAVKSDCGSGSTSGWVTYDFTTTILCAQPTAVTATGATTNTIDVSWTANVPLNFQSYTIEWGEPGFTPGTGTETGMGTSPTNTYQITGLDEATAYSVAVRADCGSEDGLSQWTVISCGTTANETFGDGIWHGYVYNSPTAKTFDAYLGLVYENENFERIASGAWTGDQNAGVDVWAGTVPSDNFSVRYKMTKTFPCGNYTFTVGQDDYARLSIDGGVTWLIPGNWISGNANQTFSNSTPWYSDGVTPIDMVIEFCEVTGTARARFQYSAALVNITTSNLTSSSVDLAFDGGDAWNMVVSNYPETDPSNPEHSIDAQTSLTSTPYPVSGLTPGEQYWVYVQTDCGGIWNSITFTTPSTCLTPTALAFNAGTNLLTWTDTEEMIDWEIKISTSTLTNPSLDEANVINDGTASGTPEFLVTANLQLDTTYHFYVRTDCQDGNSSIWAHYQFTLQYCTARPISLDRQGIVRVAFGQYPPVNDTILPVMASGNSYRNRSSVMGGVLATQTNFTVNITYYTGYTYGTKIYVDWNQDYDFDDPGENIYTGLSTNGLPTTLVCSSTIPTNTPGGIYRMRIVGTDNDGGGTPCYTSSYGAVVDYSLLLIDGDCLPVLDLTASVVGSSFADISWTGSGNAGSYTVEYGLSGSFVPGDGNANSETVNDTTITLQGLAPTSTYTVAVKTNCDENESMWMTFSFTTTAPCEVPSTLSISDVTNSSARLDWTAPAENVTSFEIEVGPLGFTPGEGAAVYTATETEAFHIIPSGTLSDATAYTVKIRSVCAGMGESEWVSQNFGTTADEEFGNGAWNGYVYQAPSSTDVPANRFMGTYLGMVTEPAQFTRPSSAAAWTGTTSIWTNGTSGPLEDFVVRYKMTYDFPCGNYTITIPTVDDAARLSIDSGQTWLNNLCSGTSCGDRLWNTINYINGNYTATVYLEGPTGLVLEFFEKGGNASVGFQYTGIPIPVTASNFTPTSVDVNLPGSGGWNIKVSNVALSDPATETGNILEDAASESPYTISGLLPDSTYFIYAQNDCGSLWGSTTVTLPAACPLPTGMSYNADTDILTWDALGQTGWNIKISTDTLSDPSNETADVIDNGVATGTPSFVPGVLQEGVTYHFYVQSDCGGEWAYLQVDMFYCIPTVTNANYYMTSFTTTGGLTNLSHTGLTTGGYFDNTDMQCIQLAGIPVNVNITCLYYSYAYRGYVDWNHDYDFNDANETIFSSNTYTNSYANTINIPANTPSGTYRLRISNDYQTLSTPCSIYNGTVRDYTLVVLSGTDCVPPLSANVTGITDNSANVNWLPYVPDPASDYAIYLTTDSIAPDENTMPTYTTSDTTYPLSGLDEMTNYHVWVRANCDDGFSMWLNVNFTTMANETYGNGEWNGYVYTSPTDRQFISYLGSVNEPAQFSRNVAAAAWTGLNPTFVNTAPDNKFSVRYRMNYNFLGNNYVFTVNADDNFRFSADGGTTWLPFTSGNTTTNATTDFWTTTANAEWHSDTIEITGSNNLVLEFYENTGNASLYFSFVNIDCEVPTNITASNFTDSTADISWDGGTAAAWTVKYGASGFDVNTGGTTEEVTANFCQMSGLVTGSLYDVYVRTKCAGDDVSTWTKLTFRLPCTAITTLPYMESFDTYGTGSNAFANCWERYNGGTVSTTNPYINTTNHSAPGAMYFSNSTSLTLVSPPFDADINTTLISFWLRREGSQSGTFSVGYFTTPNDPATFVALQTLDPSGTTWAEYTIDLSDAPAGIKQIAFRQNQVSYVWYYWLDDISVFSNTCPAPTDLTVSNINSQTADISWNAGGDETEWALKYGAAGFDVSTGGTSVTNITTTSYQVATTGLNPGATYDVYVQANCPDNDNSLWVKVSFIVPCAAITTLPFSENFDTTPVGTNASPSVPTCWSYLTNNNKGPYVTPMTVAYHHSSPNVLDFNWPGATAYALASLPPMDASIQINMLEVSFYGRNSNTAAGEFIVGVMTNPADFNTFTPVDTMPKTETVTQYSVDFASYAGSGQYIAFLWIYGGSNGYYLDDVVVDYNGTTGVCNAPSNVTASNIDQNSATISWTASATAVSYMLEYKKVSETNYGTPIPVSGTSHSLSSLTPNTAYNVRVKSVCADGESNYANAAPFTTLSVEGCNPPTNVLVSNILDESATVTWTAGGTETSWVVEHRKGDEAYSSQTVNQRTANLGNLTPNTLYDVRVKAVCGSGNESEYTVTTFTTAPEGVVHYTITPSVDGGGTITPAIAVQVAEGESQRFEFAPNTGQMISAVLIDGVSETWNTADSSYTFTNVQANHTIEVVFVPLGIEDYDLLNSIHIFPNPTKNTLNVKTEMLFETVAITNMLGQVIHSSSVNDLNFSIDVSSYNAGVYFIKLSGSTGSAVKKFVVN